MELSVDEAVRLSTLLSYGILDSDFEEPYDRLTRLAAHLFHAPISAISLIDQNRQWFKSQVGLDVRETPRKIAFCDHAIRQSGVFVVTDAQLDGRFADNPLVTGAPSIRFYAGAPITSPEGMPLGTVCVIDRAPRDSLTASEADALKDFSGLVGNLLESRRQAIANGRQLHELRAIADTLIGRIGL